MEINKYYHMYTVDGKEFDCKIVEEYDNQLIIQEVLNYKLHNYIYGPIDDPDYKLQVRQPLNRKHIVRYHEIDFDESKLELNNE